MNISHNLPMFRLCAAILVTAQLVLLAGCQGFPEDITAIFTRSTSAADQATVDTPFPTNTPRIRTPLPATFTPGAEQVLPTATQKSTLPVLLADFPVFEGAQVAAEGMSGDANNAAMLLQTSKSPVELAAFFRKALEGKGWTLRFTEGNAVGGFVQEWKKEKRLMTVEYHFSQGKPVVNIDARVVDSNQALALLLGFPLPNGSEVLRASGSTIDLYVPEDLEATVDFFKQQVVTQRWRWEKIKPTGWCGSRGCQEEWDGQFAALAALAVTPTPDSRKAEYYQAIMPDFTEAEITFLPQQDHTRVYIKIHFLDLRRSGISVALYPKATITAIMPGVAMFETEDSLKEVVKFYDKEFTGLGWVGYDFTINQADSYSRSWGRKPGRVVTLTLSAEKGIVYSTLTCSTCVDPYFVIPSSTPSPAPSK